MCCDKIILCLSLVLFIIMMYGDYHVVNVVLMGVVCLLLVNRVIKYEYFNTVSMKSLTDSIENPLNNEQQIQESVITQLENKVKMYKNTLKKDADENVTKQNKGILIKSSCHSTIENETPNPPTGNTQPLTAFAVTDEQLTDLSPS